MEALVEPYSGAYVISDAARIINVTSRIPEGAPRQVNNRHLIRWIRRGLTLPLLATVPGRDLLMSFEDLVSMRVIALLRAAGVTWRHIYKAHSWLREVTQSERPFATEMLWTDIRQAFASHEGEIIAASLGGQYPFVSLIEEYLVPVAGLTFEEGIAATWSPQAMVLLKPSIQFGAPCVQGTRIPTAAIASMNNAGDSVELIARAYRIEHEKVVAAIHWEKRLTAAH